MKSAKLTIYPQHGEPFAFTFEYDVLVVDRLDHETLLTFKQGVGHNPPDSDVVSIPHTAAYVMDYNP